MCVDKDELHSNSLSYLKSNLKLANDTLAVVYGIRERLEKMLRTNLSIIQHPVVDDNNESEDEEEVGNGVDDDQQQQPQSSLQKDQVFANKLAETIYGKTSGRTYTSIKDIVEEITDISLPSIYMLDKLLPNTIEHQTYNIDKSDDFKQKQIEINHAVLGRPTEKNKDIKGEELLSYLTPSFVQQQTAVQNQSSNNTDNETISINGAKLKGCFPN